MLRSTNDLTGYTLHASDGDIGRCHDFLFDDHYWLVRYMVAKTAKWLPGRKVVIAPALLGPPDWAQRRFPVRLTRQEIEDSPPLDEHAPVSRQYELSYHQYFAVPYYWAARDLWGAYPDPKGVIPPAPRQPPPDTEQTVEQAARHAVHLRSAREVIGYRLAAKDGDVGHVENLLLDDASWVLRYLVADTRNWLPGRKVLLPPAWAGSIDWVARKVHVGLTRETIRSSPAYDPGRPVDRAYETTLYEHYGQRRYW